MRFSNLPLLMVLLEEYIDVVNISGSSLMDFQVTLVLLMLAML